MRLTKKHENHADKPTNRRAYRLFNRITMKQQKLLTKIQNQL